jgi:predicted nucleotidyltransferase component of viral defense system
MDPIIRDMIKAHSLEAGILDKRVVHEVLQQVVLAGLYRSGFFEKAAFYGGTCLRIFHGLDRFSEDLDFSLYYSAENTRDFSHEMNRRRNDSHTFVC